MKIVSKILLIALLLSMIVPTVSFSTTETTEVAQSQELEVQYSSHVQDFGWEADFSKKNGQQSGTTGKNKKIEAMKIRLANNDVNTGIKYSVYVDGQGWQNSTQNGEIAGTTGKNLKMLGIKINLVNLPEYSVMYRIHVEDFGWKEWRYDGQKTETIEYGKKIEAIEIKLVPKIQEELSVSYSSHVQDFGWEQDFIKKDGQQSGTTGKNKKVEAVKIRLTGNDVDTGIRYKTYVEKNGWQNWQEDGDKSGSTGKNLKIYGIKIELVNIANKSVQYRVHMEDFGWSEWMADGKVAGAIAEEKKIEAIEVKITDKVVNTAIGVKYNTYVAGQGWQEDWQTDGEVAGTTGKNLKMLGLKVNLVNAQANQNIKYRIHVEDYGWLDWVSNGEEIGKMAQGKKIEAIQLKLENMDEYTVEYRVHVQDYGWQDWYIDGEAAGTTGKNKKIEAIQIRIVPKYKRHYMGIDVSHWQGEIDYNQMVESNKVDFMIARIGWYSTSSEKLVVDSQFERNYKEARSRNIPLGAYVYSYATSVEESKKEAEAVVKYLKETNQTNYELPIFYDLENDNQISLGKETLNQMAITFCETLKNAGYKVGVYSYSYWFDNYMDLSKLPNDYALWVAQYDKNDGKLPSDLDKYAETHDIWQYTSTGKVDGIQGDVDMNICYKKYF